MLVGGDGRVMYSDDDRFSLLYKKYGPVIYARCRRILGDRLSAEDATQEVFLKVARYLDRAPDSEEALLWIHRIATNHCINELRTGKRRPTLMPEAKSEEAASRGGEAPLVDRDLARKLMSVVPDHLSKPAWLHYVDGMSHDEVGRALGLSRRTIFNYLADFQQRARRFLGMER